MGYSECYELQKSLLEKVSRDEESDTLLLVEHPPVLTLGANFHKENLLFTEEQYQKLGIQVVSTDRGGDVTYHCPGQLVIYPIFNLAHHGKDLHKWLRNLEEVVLRGLEEFGLQGRRFSPYTGVWVEDKKIAAIGIKVRKWVSMHGIALNCNNDLRPFEWFVPCGIREYGVTSLTQVLCREVSCQEVIPILMRAFEEVFESPLCKA
jgi:lipoyl(octanoyl) transferase